MRESVAGLGANLVQWASHMVTPPSPSAGGDSAPRTRIDRGMLQAASDSSDDQNDIGQSVLEKPGFGARDAASITVGFIPFVGSAQSIVELVSGYDYISGEPTNRWLAAVGVVAGVVPGGKGALKAGAKATKILGKTASHADEFADAAKAATKAPISTVERGWLQFWEGRGIGNSRGHVIAQHVGKSDADLIARIGSNKKISAASSFTDQATSEAVIGGAIRQNRTQLSAWLRTAQQGDRLPLPYSGTDVIGRGIKKGQSVVGDRTNAKIILQALGDGKYHILTAFPQ